MLKSIKRILKCVILGAIILGGYQIHEHYKPQPIEPMTAQRRASHMVVYENGTCTGTAIGPHAFLTASHCNKEKLDTVKFDNAVHEFHIEKTLTDGADHDIYLLDGPAFTNFVPYRVRPAKLGEHVHLYGSVGGVYPPRRLDGVRISYDDPSDVDADAGEVEFDMPVNHGDSGSAVFNDDGTIAAVTTYLLQDEPLVVLGVAIYPPTTALDFTPSFTDDQIQEALNFVPKDYVPPAPKTDAPKKTLNPFFFFQ